MRKNNNKKRKTSMLSKKKPFIKAKTPKEAPIVPIKKGILINLFFILRY